LGQIWDAWWHLLLNVLVAINSVVHNPGIAIILFTLLIRFLTVPLTMKSLRSSRNMQQVQPLIKEVQKKYSKDKAKQQEETMRIYQEYGINPAAGCFPVVVQFPVFIGLYSALRFTLDHGTEPLVLSQVLYNPAWIPYANFAQPFLWVPNLARPDVLFIALGFGVGMWPILSAFFQFIQGRMSMPIRDPNSPMDPQARMMGNMMNFMPLIIFFTSLTFPAGTVVYWAMSNLFGAVQQYFINGWGSLPKVPGFGWLPIKEQPSILPPPVPKPNANAKKGLMARMMDQAVEAQKAQKSQQAKGDGANDTPEDATPEVPRVKKKGSEPQVKIVPTTTMKTASDLKYRKGETSNGHTAGTNGVESSNGNGVEKANGVEHTNGTVASGDLANPAPLPRKKRSRK